MPPVTRRRPRSARLTHPTARGARCASVFGSTALAFFVLALVTACGTTGKFIWYTQLPRAEWGSDAGEYVIGPGDTISIGVYEQPAVSRDSKVRSDGRLAITFLGEIVAAGKRPAVLAQEIEARLRQFIVSPRVTVNVLEARPITITVLGEVMSRGNLTLPPPAGLLQALAQAGGLTEFASEDEIYVLRQIPEFRRIRFTLEAVMNNESSAAMFPLRNGDVIIVE
jgi:polysaccharide export outer membrane protein